MSAALARFAERLAASGLDLAAPLALDQYNARVPEALRWDPFGRPAAQAVLIGNTRALWDALRAHRGALAPRDPVDHYVAAAVAEALPALGVAAAVRHAFEAPPRLLAAVHAAEAAGLAWRAPSQLAIHPVHGPWIALRALVVLDTDAETRGTPLAPPCGDCAHACEPALARAMAASEATHAGVRATWRTWLAVRDACPVGRASRYDDAALCYHYTHDPAALALALEAPGEGPR